MIQEHASLWVGLRLTPAYVLAYMVCAHFLCDFPLQGDFLGTFKNPLKELTEFVGKSGGLTIEQYNGLAPAMQRVIGGQVRRVPWQWMMVAHCAIQAGAVLVITTSPILAAAEFVIHISTDYLKCKGKFGFSVDQSIHLACKVLWAIAFEFGV